MELTLLVFVKPSSTHSFLKNNLKILSNNIFY